MTRSDSSFCFSRTALALAVCAMCLPGHAQTKVEETTVSVGVGFTTPSQSDRAQFGQYNGLGSGRSTLGLLDIDYTLRNEEADAWMDIKGVNLLGDNRSLSMLRKSPTGWKLSVSYDDLVRFDPNAVNTALVDAGSINPRVVNALPGLGNASELHLSTKRSNLGLGFAKWVSPAMQVELSANAERKQGSRLFGIGMTCPSAIAPGCIGTTAISTGGATLMLPEPIDATHSQLEARLNYSFEKLRFNVGYYGSFYRNANTFLSPSIPGSLNNALGTPLTLSSGLQSILSLPVSLAPDNQSHQIDLTGSYDLTSTTRATARWARTHSSQLATFAGPSLATAPAGLGSLGGDVLTTTAKLGLHSRPLSKLTLLADVRYDNRDDNTPIAVYNAVGTGANAISWTNRGRPFQKTRGKLQANWQFDADYRGSVGADYESIDRGVFTPTAAVFGVSALRQRTTERTLNTELRRRLADDFSGALSFSRARRDGSNWLQPSAYGGVTEVANPTDIANGFLPTAVFMPTLADRQRDKTRLVADWQPAEQWSLQFSGERGSDSFTAPTTYGLRSTSMDSYSIDVNYVPSENWAFNGYVSAGNQTLHQARPAGYVMGFVNTNNGFGLGFKGKASSVLELGGNFTFADDKNVYAQTLGFDASPYSVATLAATGGLPDINYRQRGLKFYGKYALDKRSALRLDLVFQESTVDDWTWGSNGVAYTYSDGTTVLQQGKQNAGAIGLTYSYQLP